MVAFGLHYSAVVHDLKQEGVVSSHSSVDVIDAVGRDQEIRTRIKAEF